MEWSKKEVWKKTDHTTFTVEVIHHTVIGDKESPRWWSPAGCHRWNAYAYLYPDHPHFAAFEGEDFFQMAAVVMPLHCGASMLRYNCGLGGNIDSVQVGCDYNHLNDDHFTYMETEEQAYMIFADASKLVDWLEKRRDGKKTSDEEEETDG